MLCPIRLLYTIQPGDSIYRIANIFKTTINHILDMNPGLIPHNLYIGSEIMICPGAEFIESLTNIIYPQAAPHPSVQMSPPSWLTPPVDDLPPINVMPFIDCITANNNLQSLTSTNVNSDTQYYGCN